MNGYGFPDVRLAQWFPEFEADSESRPGRPTVTVTVKSRNRDAVNAAAAAGAAAAGGRGPGFKFQAATQAGTGRARPGPAASRLTVPVTRSNTANEPRLVTMTSSIPGSRSPAAHCFGRTEPRSPKALSARPARGG